MRKLLGLILSICLFFTASLPLSSRSEAAVGLIIKSRTTKVVGGLSAGGGAVFSVLIYNAAMASTATGMAAVEVGIAAAVYVSLGLAVGFLGLIVLDDQTVADFKFLPLEQPAEFSQAISVYNSELDQLNAIKERIESEYDKNSEIDTKALWNEYGQSLSPETFAVAQAIADGFMQKLEPQN